MLTIAALIGLALAAVAFLVFSAFGGASLKIAQETTYITSPLKSDGKQVDYFVAWEQESYPEAIATDDNGYRQIVQRLGAPPDATPDHFAEVCQKLGLDAGTIAPDMTLEEPYSFLQVFVAGADFDAAVIDKLLGSQAVKTESAGGVSGGGRMATDESRGEEFSGDEYGADDESEGSYVPQSERISMLDSRLGRPCTLDDLPMMDAWLAENGPAMDVVGEAVRKPVFTTRQRVE